MKVKLLISYLLLLVLLWSCNNPIPEATTEVVTASSTTSKEERSKVNIIPLKAQTFQKEILSQGKIEAKNYIEVGFDVQERIEAVLVETGQRVTKGAVLARLRNFEWENQLHKIEHQIEQAKIQLEAKLIAMGYTLADSIKIPPAILKTARLESNLKGLELEREMALFKLEQSIIRAPISGIIGEVEAQAGNASANYKKLCTLIDDQQLEAVFFILEQELALVKKGQHIDVSPLHQAQKKYQARIKSYLPEVNEQGMIKVFASIQRPDRQLLKGMNVHIAIQENLPKQLVIPKSAVVDRQNRLVVFVHKEGQAHWKYVQLGLENSESYTITEGLEEGEEVIIDNNFHLSHLEPIEVIK
jgi:RND family efflux transporter MFP subunit